jgi:hypothetical protein
VLPVPPGQAFFTADQEHVLGHGLIANTST